MTIMVIMASEVRRASGSTRQTITAQVAICSLAKCCSSTLEKGRIISDEAELKAEPGWRPPLWPKLVRHQGQIVRWRICLPVIVSTCRRTNVSLLDRQQAFGYSRRKSLKFLMAPMATYWSGSRLAPWAPIRRFRSLSSKPKLLHTYFKQNFAQVTNPPIDPIREELVMSVGDIHRTAAQYFGSGGHLRKIKRLEVRISRFSTNERTWKKFEPSATLPTTHSRQRRSTSPSAPTAGADGMEPAIARAVRAPRKRR